MKKIKLYILLVFLAVISFFSCDKVLAEFGSNLSSNGGSFLGCGEPDPNNKNAVYNGCIGIIGYTYTIIDGRGAFSWNESKTYMNFSYSIVSGTQVYYENSQDSPSSVNEDITSGGDFFKKVLRETGISETTFFNSNYSILIEPKFQIVYDPYYGSYQGDYKAWKGTFSGNASEVAGKIYTINGGKPPGGAYKEYNGFWSVNKNIPCTAYIADSDDWHDSYCTNPPDSNYRGTYLQMAMNSNRYGKWVIYASDITRRTFSLTINKIDASINSSQSGVKFTISGDGISDKEGTTDFNGTLPFDDLPNGTYTITEKVPSGYASTEIGCEGCTTISGNQLTVTINGGNKTITVTNNKTCQSEFDALSDKTNPIERIKLYEKYKYRNLLNFSNTTNPCSNTETDGDLCKPSFSIGCLSAETRYSIKNFTSTNMSCYKETIKVGNLTGYCGFTFNLNNNLSGVWAFTSNYKFEGNFKSGQMVLNRNFTDRLIAIGELKKTCYVYGSSIGEDVKSESNPNYSDYIDFITFDNQKLINSQSTEGWKKESNSNYATFTKIYEAKYSLLPVYSANGGGKIQNKECDSDNCKLLGYGFATKLNTPTSDRTTGTQFVEFTLNITDYFKKNVSTIKNQRVCKYEVKNEILELPQSPNLTSDLNIEFRIIDTDNPFPGKSGQGRTPGSNWRLNDNIEDFDFYKDGDITLKDVLYLEKTIGGAVSLPETISNIEIYDINKNGKVDIKDALLIEEIIRSRLAGFEDGSRAVMDLTNNSYNKNGTGPKYTITLTSDTIKEIRNYNRTNSYDDYNLTCDENGYNCESTFLKDLKEGIVNGNPVSSILVDIEEETGKFNWNPESCGECRIGNSISIFD